MQKPVVQAMVAMTSAVGDLVRDAKTGETVASKMADTITTLVDALALLNHAMQDLNQHRRDDLKGEMNQSYKGLSKGASGTSALLYGDDLTGRIKDINESNRVASSRALEQRFESVQRSTSVYARARIRSTPTLRGKKLDGTFSRGFFRPNPAKPFPGKTINVQQQQARRDASVEAEASGAQQLRDQSN